MSEILDDRVPNYGAQVDGNMPTGEAVSVLSRSAVAEECGAENAFFHHGKPSTGRLPSDKGQIDSRDPRQHPATRQSTRRP